MHASSTTSSIVWAAPTQTARVAVTVCEVDVADAQPRENDRRFRLMRAISAIIPNDDLRQAGDVGAVGPVVQSMELDPTIHRQLAHPDTRP